MPCDRLTSGDDGNQQVVKKGSVRLICIAGPTSSGKTTFATKLSIALRNQGFHAVPLTVDHYYLPLDRQPKYQVGVFFAVVRFSAARFGSKDWSVPPPHHIELCDSSAQRTHAVIIVK